jgi:5-methylcytosine-specific restriction endonuclease McrA
MRKEAKRGECEKCGRIFYIHEHHILPRAIFGENGETIKLCPNCHTHYHEYQNLNQEDMTDQNETERVWSNWIRFVVVVCVFIVVGVKFFF